MTPAVAPAVVRRRALVTGVVQGVGFRPFVYRLASGLGLAGLVGNDAATVFLEVEGPAGALEEFDRRLRAEAPPLASITGVAWSDVTAVGEPDGFRIVESRDAAGALTVVPPDVATCPACVRELFDPADRRHRHPFITCTDCGPRFTIIRALPYDRTATTMAGFAMCARCALEYADPADRRFHAQPIACPDCGPTLSYRPLDGERATTGDDAIAAAQEAIAAGRVVAVKGLGGYHLACAADDPAAVAELRARKARDGKPLALLVRDLEVARRLAVLGPDESAVLTSPARPIVLLRRHPGAPVAAEVAPGTPLLGLMLPYTPVHHLLLAPVPGRATPVPDAVVLTSANLSDEPLCHSDADAAERLPGLADAVLDHDRPIEVPCDDSVVRVVDGRDLPIRRSRGYAPLPVDLGIEGPRVLAVGGELKNAFCLTDGRRAFCSAHVGDMGSLETSRAFDRAVERLTTLRGRPERLAADRHPAYLSREKAERFPGELPLDLVQHHHAHLMSLLAEHGRLGDPAVGVAFDGTGYGDDATVWGGEILSVGPAGHRFERVAHLAAVPLVGGDAAVRHPWRMALVHLRAAGLEWAEDLAPVAAASAGHRAALRSQLDSGLGAVATSSVGRLFDAVASLLDVRHHIDHEGQAAIELEVLAEGAPTAADLALDVHPDGVLDPAPVIRGIVAGLRAGVPAAVLARGFHDALAEAVTRAVALVTPGPRTVGLTGGSFQNVLLLRETRRCLEQAGHEVLVHRAVPPNDGGLALGQAAVAVLTARADAADDHHRRAGGPNPCA